MLVMQYFSIHINEGVKLDKFYRQVTQRIARVRVRFLAEINLASLGEGFSPSFS